MPAPQNSVVTMQECAIVSQESVTGQEKDTQHVVLTRNQEYLELQQQLETLQLQLQQTQPVVAGSPDTYRPAAQSTGHQ